MRTAIFRPDRYASAIPCIANAQALARQYASDIRSNWHPAGTDWQAIITHEIGHAIDGFISQKLDVGGRSFYRDWYQNSAMLQKKVADKLNIAPTRDRISKEVSRYGGKQYGGMVCRSLCRRHAFEHAAPYGSRIDEGTG